ncbi:MAG TPA: protein-L-isoaspartate(D-aspartate) O-methyltransferase [Gammaproteobacteria bacterium]|nr:protein-L-isoaspartate(D-aspartate) O-methyltransferase [Gammaproteobacteria bacterium]
MKRPVQRMLEEIESEVRYTSHLTGRRSLAPRILDALREVPRHKFVPDPQRPHAYDNRPLSIGNGQTISQPYIVAIMTDLLDLDGDDVVLEVGTGSGYQAAVLSRLVKKVYTVEIIPALAERAAAVLKSLGYDNVETRIGDGHLGWPEHAPYDAIIVTAAAPRIPPPLVDQLKPGGRMIIPVGPPYHTQELILLEKTPQGEIHHHDILPVAFVPLTGKEAARKEEH